MLKVPNPSRSRIQTLFLPLKARKPKQTPLSNPLFQPSRAWPSAARRLGAALGAAVSWNPSRALTPRKVAVRVLGLPRTELLHRSSVWRLFLFDKDVVYVFLFCFWKVLLLKTLAFCGFSFHVFLCVTLSCCFVLVGFLRGVWTDSLEFWYTFSDFLCLGTLGNQQNVHVHSFLFRSWWVLNCLWVLSPFHVCQRCFQRVILLFAKY